MFNHLYNLILARLAIMGRALHGRNYMLFFMGQGVSLIGTWTQRMALGWLVYRLTGSEWMLGVVGFSGQILTFFFSPIAGVLADRFNKRRLLVITQFVAMLQAFLLATLTLTGVILPWHIIVLSLMLGMVNSFDIPIRQSFIIEMLQRREDLPSAIALNSFMVNGGKIIGPALAGLLIAVVGEGVCFVINGASFLAVIAALLAMQLERRNIPKHYANVLAQLKEGFTYAFGHIPIRDLLLLLAWVNIMGMPYAVLMPVFAKDILHGQPQTMGWLMGATGFGAIFGAIFLASRRNVRGLLKVIAAAVAMFAVTLIVFANSQSVALSLAMLVVVGFGGMVQMASTNTLIQTLVDDDKRGRVMSIYAMCFMGMTPLGNLLIGGLAGSYGAPAALT
ncbi:MAG: MFS transporter, partial [Planctomycetaceae bacterium]